MKTLQAYIHSYLFALLQPGRVHDWLKYDIAPWNDGELPPRPALAESIGLSWVMAIIQGLGKIALASVILKFLIEFQLEQGWDFALVDSEAELLPYYFLVLSTALDLVFFPVLTLVVTQFWNVVISGFGRLLEIEKEERMRIADQVTVVALSSNFFLVLPILGVFLQKIAWFILMYKGLRKNLGASRSLSVIILFTPTIVMVMIVSLIVLAALYFAKTAG